MVVVNSFVIIEIVEENDDRITACKIRFLCDDQQEARDMYTSLRESTTNKIILVPNITLEDISSIFISDWIEL
ncbi:hypothetical protein EBS02_11500 [bacterium]|nr:hypothetical protein [bacterium]